MSVFSPVGLVIFHLKLFSQHIDFYDLIDFSFYFYILIGDKVDIESIWGEFFQLLVQLGSGSVAGANYVEKTLKTGRLLIRCVALRENVDVVDSADDLLTWFLARTLDGNQTAGPTAMLRSLLRCVPASVADLADWISRDKRTPFGAKCSALVLLYQLELCSVSTSK